MNRTHQKPTDVPQTKSLSHNQTNVALGHDCLINYLTTDHKFRRGFTDVRVECRIRWMQAALLLLS